LSLWYPAFEVYAASSPPDNAFFHGAHVAAPADLERVRQALHMLVEQHGETLTSNPLPSLEQLRSELGARSQAGNGMGTSDEGSLCHMMWHWIHGDH
jgi:hypothetical protein